MVEISDLDLFELVHASEPNAAAPLYERFGSGVRAILRHKLPDADLEIGVFHVLVTVARAIRQGQIQDPDRLRSEVRTVTNTYVASLASAHKCVASESRLTFLDELEPQEREILMRLYHKGQSEEQIRRETKIPRETISSVRRRTRKRFLARGTD
jgi:DNA-binding NarL/FixJ family response regulator